MTTDLISEFKATLDSILCRTKDHSKIVDLCWAVLNGETWEEVLGVESFELEIYSLLRFLSQLEEKIEKAGLGSERDAAIEHLAEKWREIVSKEAIARQVTKPVIPWTPPQQQTAAQVSQMPAARQIGTPIRIPTKLVKCPIPLSPTFSGTHLVCTWGDLLWATISVGRPGISHMMQHGAFSWYEMAYRLCMMEANLDLASSAELVKTGAFTALDPSEKNAISYFFGLAFVKLFAGLALDVPWLLHVDRYRVALGITTDPTTNVRPDLIGCSVSGEWFAFEAKGRSGAFSTGPIAKGKYQLEKLLQVQGRSPKMRLAAQTYFKAGKIAFHCEDPEPEPVGYGIEMPDDAYFGQYYGPVVDMLDRLRSQTSFIDFPGIGVAIGLHPDVYRMVQAKEWKGIRLWGEKAKHLSTEDLIVGRDGLMVRNLRGPSEQGITASEGTNPTGRAAG